MPGQYRAEILANGITVVAARDGIIERSIDNKRADDNGNARGKNAGANRGEHGRRRWKSANPTVYGSRAGGLDPCATDDRDSFVTPAAEERPAPKAARDSRRRAGFRFLF
ncbi:hypothetical protein BSIN_0984 [Burkholderia singularis]|uniref:Uncharacterized protein n=1 Tax=Burkholderia singularis TaxID=1503053 RepID=A0A238HBZ9_9BURK|nr:hypothetical protein BSIN_0984 [Burkholderia singularis]